jgi:hypothetical protein
MRIYIRENLSKSSGAICQSWAVLKIIKIFLLQEMARAIRNPLT